MKKHLDFTRLRTESDIKLAKANLRHDALMQENIIEQSFKNFSVYFINSLKIAAVQTGTSILTASLVRLIQSRSK
ncbi:MAG: hypothetical protein WDZ47_11335 [Bacteroidales bacterium]